MTTRILVVDDDPRDRRVLEVSLRANGYEVAAFSNTAEARSLLEEEVFELVVAVDEAQGGSGLELCAHIQSLPVEARPAVLMILGDGARANRMRALEAGADDVLVKPVSTSELQGRVQALIRRRVRDRLLGVGAEPPAESKGTIQDVPVADLLGVFQSWGRSGVLSLTSDTGTKGTVFFRDGKPVDAEVARLSGMPALTRVLGWNSGSFQIEMKNIRRKDAFAEQSGDLVVEGMNQLESWQRAARNAPDPSLVFDVDYRVLADRLGEIPDEINGLLRLCDGVRTVKAIVDESALSNAAALEALQRLVTDGVIRQRARSSPEPALDKPAPPPAPAPRARSAEPPAVPNPADASPATRVDGRPSGTNGAPSPAETSSSHSSAIPSETLPTDPSESEFLSLLGATPGSDSAPSELALEPPETVRPTNVIPFRPAGSSGPHAVLNPNMTLPLGLAGPIDLSGLGNLALAPAPESNSEPEPEPLAVNEEVEPAVAEPEPAMDSFEAFGESTKPRPRREYPPAVAEVTAAPAAEAPPPAVAVDHEPFDEEEALAQLGLRKRSGWMRYAVAAVVLCGAGAGAYRYLHLRHGSAVAFAPAGHAGPAPAEPSHAPGGEKSATHEPGAALPLPVATADTEAHAVTPVAEQDVARHPASSGTTVSAAGAGRPSAAAAPSIDLPAGGAAKASHENERPKSAPVPAVAQAERSEHARESAHGQETTKAVQPAAAGFAESLSACRSAFAKNRMRDAAKICQAAVDANPKSAEALTLMAHTELNRGRMSSANELATRAAAIDPNNAEAHLIMGGVLQDSGRNSEAKAAYRRYLQLAPQGRYASELRSIVSSI